MDQEGKDVPNVGEPSQETSLSRSERKRNREQHRRNEVTNGLDAMAAMLSKIDPGRMKGGRWTSKKESGDGGVAMSRVELLNHALETLDRLHTENESRKRIIADLIKGAGVPGVPSQQAGFIDSNDSEKPDSKKQKMEVDPPTSGAVANNVAGQQAVGNGNASVPATTTEQQAQAATAAAHLRQQHQLAMLLGGSGMGFPALLPFGGGLFPGMNPAVAGGAPLDPTTLHALMRARGMDGAGGRIPGLDAAPSPADSSAMMAQMQQQQQFLASSGTVDEEQRSRQIQSIMAAALGGSGTNTESSATPAANTNAKPDDGAQSNKKSE